MFFRKLDPKEEESFRQWAHANYVPFSPILGIYHPVVQEECVKINKEKAGYVEETDDYTIFNKGS
jgi:hypothetical protein